MSLECAFFASLVRDAEVKISKAGKQYLRFNARTGDGDSSQFINTMVFDPEVIAVADKLVKGCRVYVEGRLSLDEWTGQDGAKRHGLSATAWHCRLSQIGRNRPRKTDRQQSVTQQNGPQSDFDPNAYSDSYR
jgi:single-stranded DNA-binding protein